MKVSDYVIDFLIKKEITDIFYVPGGGISHLINSCVGRKVKLHMMRSEQSSAFACEGYYKASGKMAVCLATSGVGSVNAMQGVASAYMDNIPMIVISGDMPGIEIKEMYRPITIYSTTILKPSDIRIKLKLAYKMAKFNSLPVLINIPGIVQRSNIEDKSVKDPSIKTKPPYTKVDTNGLPKSSPYVWMKRFKGTTIVTGCGTDVVTALQIGLNPIFNWRYGAMGFDLPAAIGVAIATKKPVNVITGDGSLLVNIQELETIKRLHLPIKIYVLDNKGYGTIRRSEKRDFGRVNEAGEIKYRFKDKLIKYIKVDPNLKRL